MIQISQQHKIIVIRLITQNSHDQYRDSKQIDKTMLDLTIRSFSSQVQNLIVKLFNEVNDQVRKAHKSIRGIKLFDDKKTLSLTELIDSKNIMMNYNFTQSSKSAAKDFKKISAEFQSLKTFSSSFSFTVTPLTKVDRARHALRRFQNKYFDADRFEISNRSETAASKTNENSKNEKNDAMNVNVKEIDLYNENKEKEKNDFDETHDDEKYITDNDDNFENNDDILKNDEDVFIETMIIKRFRAVHVKLILDEQKRYSHEKLNLRYLLNLSSIKVYSVFDLTDVMILNRDLKLLFHKKFDQERQFFKISFHIEYIKLSTEIAMIINEKMIIEKLELKNALIHLQNRAVWFTSVNLTSMMINVLDIQINLCDKRLNHFIIDSN